MHLVIWSSLRAGSHMLRSMLAGDPRVIDTGEARPPLPIPVLLSRLPKGADVVLSNPKWGLGSDDLEGAVRALRRASAKVIVLHRRDLLAQQASLALALRSRAFTGAAEPDVRVTLDPEFVGRAMYRHAIGLERIRLALADLQHVELAFEDISIRSVKAALASLDLELGVATPTTVKSAPPLADFVTNLSEPI